MSDSKNQYERYQIEVDEAEGWMDRPFKVSLVSKAPTGSHATTFYLDDVEAEALIDAIRRQMYGAPL